MLKKILISATGLLAVAIPAFAADKPAEATAPAKENAGLPLVFHEDFKDADAGFAKFELLDPADWKMAKDADGKNVLSLFKKPTAKTEVRSPFGRAIIKDLYVGEFILEAKVKSTIKAYPHQDLCLFFGEQGLSHLYYVHFGRKPDPNAGNIFIVNGADRKNLLPPHDKGIEWTENYHQTKVVRKADGDIEVYFDGNLWLKVNDKTFAAGRVGVGSFDDTGDFAEVTVWGKKAEKPAAHEPVKPKEPAAKKEATAK